MPRFTLAAFLILGLLPFAAGANKGDPPLDSPYESAFSSNRVNVGFGYKNLDSQNSTFRAVTGDIKAPYFRLSWADVINFEYDFWSCSTGLANAGTLSAYAFSVSATVPYRIGYFLEIYGGSGGRFESITVGNTKLPVGAGITYGNNAFFLTAGLKLHRGRWGIDSNLAYDLAANYSPYLIYKLGLAYEFRLE